jgi:hypothetical protein
MKRLTHIFSVALVFFIALSLLSCSDSESEPEAESNAAGASEHADESTAAAAVADAVTDASAPDAGDRPYVERDLRGGIAVADAYRRDCPAAEKPSEQCIVLRSLVVTYVTLALEEIERSRDQRGTAEALKALQLTDEPEILIAAMRVLGRFPDTPGIAEKTLPLLLDSPYLVVVQIAAQLLSQNPDPALASMAQQWSSNHGALWSDNPYALEPDFPEHYFDMGFPEFPDAEWFGPADSDRSVGWWVADSPAEVSAWLADELETEPMSWDQWSQRSSEEMTKMYQAVMDPAYMEELQKLMEQYMKSQDPAIAEEMEKKQQEMDVVSKKIESDVAKTLNNVLSPPGGVVMEDLSYFVAEEKDGHVSRAIMVYRFAGSERTMMQMAWDLRDYPPAWPETN